MSSRFLVRGTTAFACAAFATTAVLAPVQAAPATGSLAASAAFSALPARIVPFSPDLPSPDDIAKAKKSEAATAAESARIDALFNTANDRLQGFMTAGLRANSAYSDALVVLEHSRAAATTAKATANIAAGKYKSARSQLGALAGTLYKTGGMNLDVPSLLVSSSADDAMYQASTLMALSANRSQTVASAQSSAATSAALQEQATAAQKAADDAARAADEAKALAQAATDAQAAAVKENQDQRDVLLKQLATLHNTTVSLEAARVDGLQRKAQEAALAQQVKDSANTPAPVPPPSNPGQANPGQANPGPAAPPAQPQPAPVAPPVAPPTAPPVQTQPPAPTAPAGSYIQVMVNYAMDQSGTSYLWGGTGPTFDCSGLVYKAFAAAGISVPRTGTPQFWDAPQRVPLSQMRYGDLLVFDEYPAGSGQFGHIAIYVGNNQVVQALSPGFPTGVYPISSMLQAGMTIYPYAARW